MEWRPEYSTEVSVGNDKAIVKDSHPVLSSGIYNHFRVTVTEDGGTVKFVPNFLFGIPQSVLDTFYLGAEGG